MAYLLIPLSIVLTKYFPELGKQYDTWSGMGYYIGVATSKNMLGALCLVSAVFFLLGFGFALAGKKAETDQAHPVDQRSYFLP